MTSPDWLRAIAEDVRTVPGELGLREYTVDLLSESWSGAQAGEGTATETATRLLVGGQNPKVRWLTQKEIAVGGIPDGTVEVGPLTPKCSAGGVDIAGVLGTALQTGQIRTLRIKGPLLPSGAQYRVTAIRYTALTIRIQAVPAGM